MNVLRDFMFIFSYPYSLVRRATTFTWSFVWTRGLVNVLPFVQRRQIEDSQPAPSKTAPRPNPKFESLSTEVSSPAMNSSKEELESVVVPSDKKESGDTSVSSASTNVNTSCSSSSSASTYLSASSQPSEPSTLTGVVVDNGGQGDVLKVVEGPEPKSEPSPSQKNSQSADAKPKPVPSPHKKTQSEDSDSHPLPWRAKRNSTTVEEEELVDLISEHEGRSLGTGSSNLGEVLLYHITKKAKMESSPPAQKSIQPQPTQAPTPRSRGASESDGHGSKNKHATKFNKDKTRKQKFGEQRPDLNYFVGVQISNPKIHSKLEEIQNKMLDKDLIHTSVRKLQKGAFFADSMVSIKKSHVTLHVFHISEDDDAQLETVKAVLQKVWEKHQCEFEPEPVTLTVEGIGHFKNSVLFAKVDGPELEKLHKLSHTLREEFKMANIYCDESKPFTAHLTMAKLSRVKWNKEFKKHNVRAFPRDLWHDFETTFFGHQKIESLQLLKMKSNAETGYYEIVETYPFNIHDKGVAVTSSTNPDEGFKSPDRPDEKTNTKTEQQQLDSNDNKN